MKERELRTDQVKTRLTKTERARLDQEAERRGLDHSNYIRLTLHQAWVQQPPQFEAA